MFMVEVVLPTQNLWLLMLIILLILLILSLLLRLLVLLVLFIGCRAPLFLILYYSCMPAPGECGLYVYCSFYVI